MKQQPTFMHCTEQMRKEKAIHTRCFVVLKTTHLSLEQFANAVMTSELQARQSIQAALFYSAVHKTVRDMNHAPRSKTRRNARPVNQCCTVIMPGMRNTLMAANEKEMRRTRM